MTGLTCAIALALRAPSLSIAIPRLVRFRFRLTHCGAFNIHADPHTLPEDRIWPLGAGMPQGSAFANVRFSGARTDIASFTKLPLPSYDRKYATKPNLRRLKM